MALQDYAPLVIPFLLIAMATTSGRVILADARNLLELNLPDLPIPHLQPDPTQPEPELPSLPKVELPDFPGLPELNFPTLPTVELPPFPHLPAFPQFPDFSKPAGLPETDQSHTSDMSSVSSSTSP